MNQSTSQVKELAHNHSALLFVFDLLVDADGTLLVEQSLSDRRHQLEIFCEACLKESGRIQLSPATRDHAVAQRWFGLVGSSLEGVVA